MKYGPKTYALHDVGYCSVNKREMSQDQQSHTEIRPGKQKYLSSKILELKFEPFLASVRGGVEYLFQVIKSLLQHKRIRTLCPARNYTQLLSQSGLANWSLAEERLLAMHGGGTS